jgi:hypothetical protein
MNREIPLSEVRPGDFILCDLGNFSLKPKSTNIVGPVLSFLIGIFDSQWLNLQRKPWHVRFVSKGFGLSATVCEALAGGVCEKFLDSIPLEKQRAYRWFNDPLTQDWLDKWVGEHLGKPYDVMAYFSTALQYLLRAIWNRRIPRLLDGQYTCQELVMELAEDAGKPMASKRDCPMITDLCKALGIITSRKGGYKLLSVLAERKTR